ncbi:MAG: MFS transporter [Candidatus Rokubacteria bacterium]|nr:MFS transporter [Candidatus Rokubacteria bacterium]
MSTSRVFFGWWVALSFSAMVFLSTGIRFTVGPFLKPMVADLGLDRASFSLVVSVGLFLYGAVMPAVGRLADQLGARPVVVAGAIVLAGSVAANALVQHYWQLWIVYGLGMALGLAMTGHVVASAVITRWFTRRRATALSLLGAASMAGMSLLVPISMWLIMRIGWRLTYVVLAAAALVVILPLALWVMRDAPESMGLAPDGAPVATTRAPAGDERMTAAAAMQTRPFWHIALALSTCGFSMSLLSAHGVPMLTDHGYHPMVASWAFALLGGTNVVFALILGTVADRIGARPVLVGIYGGRAIAVALLFVIRDQPLAIMLVAALGGATMAGTFAMTSALTADIFGRFSVGSVFGAMFLVHQAGAALGSWLGGVSFEGTGGYGLAFAVASMTLLSASVLSLTTDVRPRCVPAASLSAVAGGR